MNRLVVPVTGVKFKSAIPPCVTSSENFTRTFLYLVILKVFEWIKFLTRHLYQIQGNRAGRNFVKSCIACHFTAHYACKNVEMNLKSTTTNGFNFQIINSLMGSWGVRLTWLDCNSYKHVVSLKNITISSKTLEDFMRIMAMITINKQSVFLLTQTQKIRL